LHQGTLCGPDEECPDRIFRCCRCSYSAQTELDGCPACGADWKSIDVGHGPGCPKNLLEEAMDTPNGGLVRRCFRILSAKNIGLTITLADITEEEFRVLELIEAAAAASEAITGPSTVRPDTGIRQILRLAS